MFKHVEKVIAKEGMVGPNDNLTQYAV